ncbi:polyphosphate kinase 1 [Aquimarina sp. 2201CG5-10]|uniref:polyphosphate kinase 1 n=1 Tax=Aquimarina callyspongiae TaxID=3098150 RepID=UPI002AB5AB5B|nr:polyphosphate kinase 1 [Aquimarina sp. 2201CG5-10]MDY8134557.1 polyphosphate kinase 1 [Aquimarina sp. 2201CG5-10]
MSLISKKYYNRDLSWLRFNHRVLQEAADSNNPLYERIKFLAIFSSNLDEFFKVRVSDIRKIKNLDKSLRKKLITKPNKLLKEIKKQVHLQQIEFGDIFNNQILEELKKEGVQLVSCGDFTKSQKEFAEQYYKDNLQNKLTININIERENKKVFIENEELYLTALLNDEELIIVKIPSDTKRFIILPKENNTYYITFVDDILKHNLANFYSNRETSVFYSIKISRDAELYIDNEYSGDLLTKIKNSLSNRDTGQVTRVLIDTDMPVKLLSSVEKMLDVNETDILRGGRYHNFKDFFGFPNPTDKNLSDTPVSPVRNQELQKFSNMFDAISEKDRLLYYPYEAFDDVLRLAKQAAVDKNVTKIKVTLYRIAKQSGLADALLEAAKNGKEVFIFIETKARFDEENNIRWGRVLEDNGAKVTYSYPGIKVHSKILFIERIENDIPKTYGYISTGNFNEKTAKIYTDFGLMTANTKITSELSQVFQLLERTIIIPKTKKLLVSPFTTRSTFRKLIEVEIENAKAGKEAYIILKLNSLQDTKMIDLLYEANNAGVRIRLIIRGICCLVPGIEGQSEHIQVTSIVDRFLEHGRVYIFCNEGKEKMYIGSADWMTRNLDHRIEVITPILDIEVYTKIRKMIQLQLDDTVKARVINEDQDNTYISATSKLRAQVETISNI